MKTAKDPRHLHRTKLIQSLFTWSFGKVSELLHKKARGDIKPIISNLKEIDELIKKSAPGRPIEQINRIDLAILRLSIFELIIKKGTPPKVVVDEAVELGKQFGSDSSPAFINGALGKLISMKKLL